jgi:predicted secreted protein
MFRSLLPLVLLTACGTPRPLMLSDFDTERSVTLRVGQTLVVALPADRSAGHGWVLTNRRLDAVMLEGEPTFTRESGAGTGGAAEGSELWRLVAVRKGQDALHFEYHTSDDREATPERVARYLVRVK